MAFAPKAVSVILEAIDEISGSVTEKQALFDIYVEQPKEIEEVEEKLLNNAFVAFEHAYNNEALEG